MPKRGADIGSGRAVVLIAATYVYFLIFAQFGFLKRLDALAIAGAHLNLVMAAMALGGIAASLLGPRMAWAADRPVLRLRCALLGAGLAAVASTAPLTLGSAVAVSLLIGLTLGLWTVTLVANLALWTGSEQPLLPIGLGTGIGYLLCNVPALFTASPQAIAWIAAFTCAGAMPFAASSAKAVPAPATVASAPRSTLSFPLVLAWFTGLIWLDSAAFYIIQNSPALQLHSWHGAGHLWGIGALHLLGALASAMLLRRWGLAPTLVAAYACLAVACISLWQAATAPASALFYPVGVSLYSVALVASPAFLLRSSSPAARGRQAGWLYATAGWVGSALGIGMGQHLHKVPLAFVAAAGVLFLIPVLPRSWRGAGLPGAAVALSLVAAAGLYRLLPSARVAPPHDAVAAGRRVYIAEGCIHCHSQYVRPGSPDVLLWGPAQDVEAIRRQQPPLIGNRRQGPDLSEVGSRRSPLWLRIHFIHPREVSYGSVMPAYAYLFADGRGDALTQYMQSLKTQQGARALGELRAQWKPSPAGEQDDRVLSGQLLFARYCATCHTPEGVARTRWAASFRRLPPVLGKEPLRDLPTEGWAEQTRLKLERIIKFGIAGTDMPGHEYLPDAEIAALAVWVDTLVSR